MPFKYEFRQQAPLAHPRFLRRLLVHVAMAGGILVASHRGGILG